MRMIRLNKERIYLHAPNACVIAAVSVSPAPPVNELEDAIRRAAARHGSLAMRVERRSEGENGYEQCEPKLEISRDRLESEFDWLGAADDLREYVFDTASGEMARFVILEGEGETQLVCGVHRLAGDERSVVLLLSDVAAALGGAELSPLPMESHEQPERKVSGMLSMMVKMCNRRWKQQGRAFGETEYRKLCEKAAEQSQLICSRSFDANMTSAIQNACREHGVSCADAVAAAVVYTWREQCEVNMTSELRESGCAAMGDYSTCVTLAVDPRTKSFWQTAAELKAARKTAEGDPAKLYAQMSLLDAAEPTLIDAAWYQTYDLVRHPMVGQLADMLGLGMHSRSFSVTGLGRVSLEGGGYRWSGLAVMPPWLPLARRTVAEVELAGELVVTMQLADDADADADAERFEDAMLLLEEATVDE